MTTHVPDRRRCDAPPRRRCDLQVSLSHRARADRAQRRTGGPGSSGLRSSGSRRAAPRSRRGSARLVEERSGRELPVGALDITFHRDDVHVRDGGRPPGRQPIVRATSIPFSIEGMTVVLVDDVLYTGRTIRAAIDALLEFGRPARVQLAVLVDRGHRELPIRPDYVGKNLPTGRDERIQVELVEIDELDGVLLVRRARGRRPWLSCEPPPAPRRHLLSIATSTRDDVERLLDTARSLAASLDREVKKLPTLRGRTVVHLFYESLDAHARELRARGEATLRGHDVAALGRLVGGQGRVAEGHGADALRVRPGRDRRSTSVDRRAPPRLARHRRARRERGRREAPAPDAGAPRPLHDAGGTRPPRGPSRRDRRRRAPLTSRALARPGARARRRRCGRHRPADAPAARHRGARLRGLDDIARSRTRTSSTCCACSASAWTREAFVPSLREFTALYGITPERVRPGQVVMHPGPMNRGVEIDPRVADSEAALVIDQVRAGLVVRMAVLYDLLTVAPARGPRVGRRSR